MIEITGAVTYGLILSFLALGVYISFRIFDFPDITADGSYALGGAICISAIHAGVNPIAATALAFCGGFGAGAVTGSLHTRLGINKLLAGILVMTGLYTVSIYVMGGVFLSLQEGNTIMTYAEKLGRTVAGKTDYFEILGSEMRLREIVQLLFGLALIPLTIGILHLFFRTRLGLAMRATGDNARMARALGVNDAAMITLGLALSNGLIALSGAHMAQLLGQADVQMGIGMIVIGLASVILGGALVRSRRFGLALVSAALGSVLYRLLVALIFRLGLGDNDLKLFTALFVFAALVLPKAAAKLRSRIRPSLS